MIESSWTWAESRLRAAAAARGLQPLCKPHALNPRINGILTIILEKYSTLEKISTQIDAGSVDETGINSFVASLHLV